MSAVCVVRHTASHRILVSIIFWREAESSVPVAFNLALSVQPQHIAIFNGRETSFTFPPLFSTLNEIHKMVFSS